MKIKYNIFKSDLGQVLIGTYNDKLCKVAIGSNSSGLIDEFFSFRSKVEDELSDLDPALTTKILNVINTGAVEEIDYCLIGTTFQKQVWAEISNIAVGSTATYGQLAARIGNPKAVRAVGSACKANPIAVIIPCHRVILGNGTIGQYAFGIHRKIELLEREKVKVKQVKDKYAGLSLHQRAVKEITDTEDKWLLKELKKIIKQPTNKI